MLDRGYCELCQTKQLGPCHTPDEAAQCPMWLVEIEGKEGEGVEKK